MQRRSPWWWKLILPVYLALLIAAFLLNLAGILDTQSFAIAFGLLEVAVTLFMVYAAVRLVSTLRRTMGHAPAGAYAAATAALQEMVPRRIAVFLAMEPFLYWDLIRWALRLGSRPGNGAVFGYTGSPRWGALLALVLLLLPVELLLWELLIPSSWIWIRLAVLVLGLWGTVYVLGLYASMRLRPHLLRAGALELRYGHFFSSHLPLGLIAAVEPVRGTRPPRRGFGVVCGSDETAYLPGDEEPRVRIELREPRMMGNVGEEPRPVKKLYLYVDKPRELLQALEVARATGDVGGERGSRA